MPFGAQIKGRESGEKETRPLAPAQDSWGGAAPCVGSMADVAMEARAKPLGVGRRRASAHLGVVCEGVSEEKSPSRPEMLLSYVDLY